MCVSDTVYNAHDSLPAVGHDTANTSAVTDTVYASYREHDVVCIFSVTY